MVELGASCSERIFHGLSKVTFHKKYERLLINFESCRGQLRESYKHDYYLPNLNSVFGISG